MDQTNLSRIIENVTARTGYEQFVTKDYLDARLAEFRLEIQREFQQIRREISEQFKWNLGLIFGLYASNVAMFIGLYALLKA